MKQRKAVAILCSSALAVGSMFLLTGANSPGKAAGPAPFTPSQHFAGYSTGTDVFVDALKQLAPPGGELANVNAGFSAAAANSAGVLDTYATAAATPPPPHKGLNAPFENEMGHALVPKELASFGNTSTSPFQSYGRGSGVEAGLAVTLPNNPDVNQAILVGLAEQAATPKTPGGNTFPDNSITKEGGPIPADPLLFASLLKGRAAGNWDAGSCPVANQDPANPGFPVDANGTNGNLDTRADMGY